MFKSIIVAAAAACITAAPAFAQDGTKPAGFGGRHGSATNLRDAPRGDEATPAKGFEGRRGSATNLTAVPRGDTAGHVKVFDGRDIAKTGARREQAPRMKSTNNMKQIGLANH